MRVDDAGQSRFVRLRADVCVSGPDQLVARHPMARGGHARQPEIGGVRQDRRQKRVLVFAALAGAEIGERRGESGRAADLVHDLGDAGRRQHGDNPRRLGVGFCRRRSLHRCNMQPTITQFDAFEFAAAEPAAEAPQATIEFGATPGQPLVGRRRQSQFGRDRRNFGGGSR